MVELATGSEAVEIVRIRVLPDGRMTREDAARYLGMKPKTLAMWALQGKGPASVLVGGRRFYFKDELDRFIAEGAKPSAPQPRPSPQPAAAA